MLVTTVLSASLAADDPLNIKALQSLVLEVAGLAIACGGLLLAYRGMTRHMAEAVTGLAAFVIGLAIIGVGFMPEDNLKSLATGLAKLVFQS